MEEDPVRHPCDPNDVGAVDLAIDPKNPRVIYAALWATRRPPWSVYAPSNLPGGGLFKSTDGGDTWKRLGGGLPSDNFVGRIGIAIAPSDSNRFWAVVDDLGSASPPPAGPRRAGRLSAIPTRPLSPPAESTSPMTPAPHGGLPMPRAVWEAAAGTLMALPSIPLTPTARISSTPLHT